MPIPTFSKYVALRKGVPTATRPPLKGMSRINALPVTDGQRKRLHLQPVRVPHPFEPVARLKPTVRHVTEIVPQHMVAKLPPAPPW